MRTKICFSARLTEYTTGRHALSSSKSSSSHSSSKKAKGDAKVILSDIQAYTIPQDASSIPKIPILSSDLYPRVRYWDPESWKKPTGNQSKHYFIQHENGVEVSSTDTTAMGKTARKIFQNVWANRVLSDGTIIPSQRPAIWSDVPEEVMLYYCHKMVAEHPFLALCKGGQWKARKFATTAYSSSMRSYKRRKAGKGEEHDENEDIYESDNDSRPAKRHRVSSRVCYIFLDSPSNHLF